MTIPEIKEGRVKIGYLEKTQISFSDTFNIF